MLRLIVFRLAEAVLLAGLSLLDRHWPDNDDLSDAPIDLWPTDDEVELDVHNDDSLLDYVVRNDVTIPDDARELAP